MQHKMRTCAEEVKARGAQLTIITDNPALAKGLDDKPIVIPNNVSSRRFFFFFRSCVDVCCFASVAAVKQRGGLWRGILRFYRKPCSQPRLHLCDQACCRRPIHVFALVAIHDCKLRSQASVR